MHEYGKNSEGLSGNLISTYCITVTNNPISPGDLSVGSEVFHKHKLTTPGVIAAVLCFNRTYIPSSTVTPQPENP